MPFSWYDVLPKHIADLQIVWERRAQAVRMRELGFTYKQIAKRMGVSVERARQIHLAAALGDKVTPPVVKWFNVRDETGKLRGSIRNRLRSGG